MLRHHGVNLVIDVGANIGQFAQGLRRAGYTGRTISFEPLAEAHSRLLAISKHDSRWEIAPRMVIGDHEGDTNFHVSANSVSSSVLDMLDQHAKAAPNSQYISNERVRVAKLDTALSVELRKDVIPFLKIDTQGYEDRVLDGAQRTLGELRGLQMEMSFIPLYKEQKLFDEMMTRVQALGFAVWTICPGFWDRANGRMLQVDVVFFKE